MATATDEIYVKILTETGSAIQNMGNLIAKLATVYISYKAISDLLKSSVKEYLASETAQTKLAMSLKITGQYSNQALTNLTLLSEQMQRNTIFTHEATQESASMLAMIGNLSIQGIQKALPALQDYASAMGIDLVTAAEQFGQAIAGGRNMFQKFGIALNDNMSAAEKFDTVLAGLNSKFKGMSEEIAKTTQGQLILLTNQWNELKEAIGGVIAKMMLPGLLNINATLQAGQIMKIDPKIITDVALLQSYFENLNKYIQANADLTDRSMGIKDWKKKYEDQLRAIWDQIQALGELNDTTGNIIEQGFDYQTYLDDLDTKYGKLNETVREYGLTQDQVFNAQMSYLIKRTGNMGISGPNEQVPFVPGGSGGPDITGIQSITNFSYDKLAGIRNADTVIDKLGSSIADLNKQAAYAIGGSLGDLFTALGTAVVTGEGSAEAFNKFVISIMSQIGQLMLAAGLKMIIEGGPEMLGFGLALAVAGGLTMFAGAAFGANMTPRPNTSTPSTPAIPDIPHLGSVVGNTTNIIVHGSVWAERDLASVVSAARRSW